MLEKKGQLQRAGRREEKGKAEAAGVQIDVAEEPATTRKVCIYLCVVWTSVVKNIDISINIDTEISERYQY